MSTVDRDARLRDAIRQAVKDALDDGVAGRAIIRHLKSETARLQEMLPPYDPVILPG